MTVCIIILILAALIALVSYAVSYIGFHSPNGRQNDDENITRSDQMDPLRDTILAMIRALNARPFERVYITSRDGLRLAGRYYHQADGAPLDICFHGWRGTPSRDFSGGAGIYFAAGHNVLMVEERAQCSSEGHWMTMGVKERLDCVDWVRYAVERFGADSRILVNGISMGAATVLMAAPDLPANVRGIVADCPYTSPAEIVRKVLGDMRFSPAVFYPFMALGARLFARFDLNAPGAVDAVRKTSVPILLIHGEDDRFVPCDMGRAIAAANPAVELHTFPGAGHGLSFLLDEERYRAIVTDFADRVLAEQGIEV